MAESHTRGEQRHYAVTAGAASAGRSAMARASDGLQFRPYTYRGHDTEEPAAVTAARKRHQALSDEIGQRRARLAAEDMPDLAPGYEWQREQLAEDDDERPAAPLLAVAPEPCRRCAELEAAIDGLKAEIRALIAARAAAEPEPPKPVRCKKCGYMTGTTGHRVMCDA